MDNVLIRLECLKLSNLTTGHLGAEEVVAKARIYENYLNESTPCSPEKSGKESGTSEQRPTDTVKVQNNPFRAQHSKK